jgi:hypothetical protein
MRNIMLLAATAVMLAAPRYHEVMHDRRGAG